MGFDKMYDDALVIFPEPCQFCKEPNRFGYYGKRKEEFTLKENNFAITGCLNPDCWMYNHAFARIVQLTVALDECHRKLQEVIGKP